MKKLGRERGVKNAGTLRETPAPYRTASPDGTYPLRTPEDEGWVEFREQCRRQMERPLALRIKYGFSRLIAPVSGESHARAFKTMKEYREWCENNLPDYLGYKRISK